MSNLTTWAESIAELQEVMFTGAELLTILEAHSNHRRGEWPKISVKQVNQIIRERG